MQGRSAFVLLLMSAPAAVASCGAGTSTSVGSAPTEIATDAVPPDGHRASRAMCSTSRGPGLVRAPASIPTPDTCTTDSDCRAGANGRCNTNAFPVGSAGAGFTNDCSYDECSVDEDCPNGGVCDCRASAGDRNRCFAADCRVDADCKETPFCSPSARNANLTGMNGRSGAVRKPEEIAQGYFCHRAADECFKDSDCVAADPDGRERCAFRADRKRWACSKFDGTN